MIIPKVLALGLLLTSSLAFASIQLHTFAELESPKENGKHAVELTFEIDAKGFLVVYDHGDIKIMADLLVEEDTKAMVCFTLYKKNASDDYEELSTSTTAINYTEPTSLSFGSTEGEILTITVDAQKV